jgi:branched-subunit amino acid transport protein
MPSAFVIRLILLAFLLVQIGLLTFGPQTADHLPAIEAALTTNDKPDWWDDAAMGVRYAAWFNLIVLTLLLGTSRWWSRPSSTPVIENSKFKIQNSKLFWPALALAVIACLVVRLPLASKSLWWDESWVIMQVNHGKWRPDSKQPDKLKFQAHDWKRAAFYYQKPTNHAPMSLAQKVSLSVWRKFTGAKREAFSDLAVRMPALLASCGAVLFLAGLLRSWGKPGAGIAAAFLLALHPWAVRYGVDARAYAFVIPLCISAMWAATRIVATGGRQVWPWVWFGLTEFLWLWAYPNAAAEITILNLVLLGLLMWQQSGWQDRMTAFMRFAVTNILAALCLIQVFLPNLMQARRWAGNETVAQPFSAALWKSTLSQMILGVEYDWPREPEAAGLLSGRVGLPGLGLSYSILLPVGILLLAVFIFNRHRAAAALDKSARWILAAPIVGAFLFTVATVVLDSYYYPRFVIASLPCVLAVVCLILSGTWKQPWGRKPHLVSALLMGLALAPLWLAQNKILMTRPYAPLRDTAEFVQRDAKTAPQPPLIFCYGLGREVLPIYEPRCQSVASLAEIEKLVQQAKAEQRPLYGVYGYNIFNRSLIPEGFKLLDDRSVFTEAAAFPAIDPEFYFRVLKFVP